MGTLKFKTGDCVKMELSDGRALLFIVIGCLANNVFDQATAHRTVRCMGKTDGVVYDLPDLALTPANPNALEEVF